MLVFLFCNADKLTSCQSILLFTKFIKVFNLLHCFSANLCLNSICLFALQHCSLFIHQTKQMSTIIGLHFKTKNLFYVNVLYTTALQFPETLSFALLFKYTLLWFYVRTTNNLFSLMKAPSAPESNEANTLKMRFLQVRA